MENQLASNDNFLREVNEPEFGYTPKAKSRAEIRREWEDISSQQTPQAMETFGHLMDVLGTTPISEVRHLEPEEINILADELLAVRAAKDIVEGRESSLKKYATDVINHVIDFNGKDSSTESGYLISAENGIKLSKEVSGGKLNVDVELLEKVLDAEQFKSVVNTVKVFKETCYPNGKCVVEEDKFYELNEEALERELKLGNIGMEQVVQATSPGKLRTAFYVRPAK